MAARVREVDAPSASPLLDQPVIRAVVLGAKGHFVELEPRENAVKFLLVHLESEVEPRPVLPGIEIEQGLADPNRREMPASRLVGQSQNSGQKAGRFFLVPHRDQRVVDHNRHVDSS